MAKKTVFLTGGTGNMGWAAVQEMLKHPNEINLKILARKSPKNEELLKDLMAKPNVQIVWGDLTDYDSLLDGITGADYVLHVGGMVSPAADWKPYRTQKTNIGAAENICKAVLAQPDPDAVKVCYIGTVAETGGRNYPIHWGRCGDPIKISIYDHYAVSKTVAERTFVESGIKNWVVMRQSGILYPNILKNMDPIMFHVPINGVLEWCTVEDSGRLMCNLVLEDAAGNLGSDFWNHYFNIGSGQEYRLSNYEFEEGEDYREVGEMLAASYVNFYFVNGAALVPQFGGENKASDKRALDILRSICKDRQIIGINARPILLGGGNIHCITQQIPGKM